MHKFDTRVFSISSGVEADPAAGVDFAINPNNAIRVLLQSVSFTFTADANAANRQILLEVLDGAITTPQASLSGFITANETIDVMFALDMPHLDLSATHSIITAPLPSGIFLEAGSTLRSNITNIQIGDQISAITYRCNFWFAI